MLLSIHAGRNYLRVIRWVDVNVQMETSGH